MRILPGKLAAVLLSCSALWVLADLAVANLQVHFELRRQLATRPGTSVASLWSDPLNGRLYMQGVHAVFGHTQVDIGSLDVPSPVRLGLVATARAQTKPTGSSSASAENIVIVDGAMTYRIKHIDLSGTTLINTDLLALLDPKNSAPLETRLRQLNAATIVVSEVKGDGGTGATEHHWTQKQVTFADVQSGKAAAVNAGSGSLAVKVGQNVTNFEIGRLQLTAADLAQMAHVLETTREGDEQLKPLYETAVVNAVKLTDVTHNQMLTIGSLREQGIQARALGADAHASSTRLSDGQSDDAAYRAIAADVFKSVAGRVIELDDVHATMPPSTDTGDITNIGWSRLVVRDIGGGLKVGGLDARDMHLEGRQVRLSIASATTGGFTIPIAALVPQDHPTASLDLPPNTPLLDSAQASGISVDIQAPATTTSEQHVAFSVAEVQYAAPGLVSSRPPKKATISVNHLAFDISPQDQASQALYLLGYRRVDLSSHLATSYTASGQTLSVDGFDLNGRGMGSIELKLDLANVADGVASMDREVQNASWSAVLLKDADLSIRNDGLIDKAIEFKAALDGVSVPDERAALINLVTTQLPALAGGSEKMKPVTAAIAQFISSPKTLHLGFVAKTGLGAADIATMSTPQAVLDRLDISATANE